MHAWEKGREFKLGLIHLCLHGDNSLRQMRKGIVHMHSPFPAFFEHAFSNEPLRSGAEKD